LVKGELEGVKDDSSYVKCHKALVQAGIEHECGELAPVELRRRMFLRIYGIDFTKKEQERIIDSLAD